MAEFESPIYAYMCSNFEPDRVVRLSAILSTFVGYVHSKTRWFSSSENSPASVQVHVGVRVHLTEETLDDTRRVHGTGADRTDACGDSVVLRPIRRDLRQASGRHISESACTS